MKLQNYLNSGHKGVFEYAKKYGLFLLTTPHYLHNRDIIIL